MKTWHKVVIVVGIAGGAFVAGRQSAPEKIKIETKVVEVEKKKTETEKDKSRKTVVVEKTNPDGSKEKTTTIVEDTNIKRKTEKDATTVADTKTEKTNKTADWSVDAMVGLDIPSGTPVYGASVKRRILGPINVGVFGLTNGSCGGSIGITF